MSWLLVPILVTTDPFSTWKEAFGKTYDNDTTARAVFQDNYEALQAYSPMMRSFDSTVRDGRLLYRLNRFADVTDGEFVSRYVIEQPFLPQYIGTGELVGVQMADEVDWNRLTTAYDQDTCKSSWLHALVNTLEAHEHMRFKRHRAISTEYFERCLSFDCNKGELKEAVDQAYTHGYCYADEYARDGCKCARRVRIRSYDFVTSEALAHVLNAGPVIAVFTMGPEFQFYQAGVLHDHCSELDDRNHAVVLTGYGIDDDGVPFWRGVNTFGPEWGEGGYFRIERNATKCGIDQEVLMIGM